MFLFTICFSLGSLFGGGGGERRGYELYTQVEGNWTITKTEMSTQTTTIYKLDFFPQKDYLLYGELMGEDEDGILTPFGVFAVANATEVLPEDNVTTYSLLYTPDEDKSSFEEIATLSSAPIRWIPNKYHGTFDKYKYVIHQDECYIEIDLFNTETKEVTNYNMKKPAPPRNANNNMMGTMMPMMMMMMSMNMFRPGQRR